MTKKERGNLETKKIREVLKNEKKKIRKDGCDWRIRQRSFKLPVLKTEKKKLLAFKKRSFRSSREEIQIGYATLISRSP